MHGNIQMETYMENLHDKENEETVYLQKMEIACRSLLLSNYGLLEQTSHLCTGLLNKHGLYTRTQEQKHTREHLMNYTRNYTKGTRQKKKKIIW